MERYRELVVPSKIDKIPSIRAILTEILEHFDFSHVYEITISFEEALVNAIRHGNDFDPSKSVHISISVSDDNITISLLDEGSGFDYHNLPEHDSPDGVTSLTGRGILLMRSYMDAEFSENGRRVTLNRSR